MAKSPHALDAAGRTAERDPLDLIAEEFAELCRRGKKPSVTDFVIRYPDHAEDLKDLLPTVGQMESLKRQRKRRRATSCRGWNRSRSGSATTSCCARSAAAGWAIVFEAEQASLGRRVAVKVLPNAARSDADKRERFLREAQAAARLHHTNIVPVFGVGEDDGMPYYVMQYIRGCGLDDIVHGWKTEHRKRRRSSANGGPSRRLIAQAADALDYAHSEGVLHRDVKPANLLLDTAGHLWITDFGLAKLLDEHTLTATGHVLGTFQYMAPEALAGKSDGRTDVYGLGMTLYEMLTGKVPFEETNPAALVKLIGASDPPSPRSVDAKIPKDLETICLKAIAREPSRRYASVGEFAEDLLAYLVGRPISARRLSVLGRGRLWCNRNPVVAGLSAAVLAILAGSAVFGWSMYLKTKQSLINENVQRREADTQRLAAVEQGESAERRRVEAEQATEKYEKNLAMSMKTIENFLEIISQAEELVPTGPGGGPGGPGGPGPGAEGRPDRLGPPDGERFGPPGGPMPKGSPDPIREAKAKAMREANVKLLEEVLAFYEKFAEANNKNPKLRFDAARAWRHVGEIQFTLGRPDKGEIATQKAVRMFEELRGVYDPERVRFELEQIRERGDRRKMRGPPMRP